MWIILAVVILFNGFPRAYSQLSIYLHVPLTMMLVGIILRGCAFTFRHYDAKVDESTKAYSFIFRHSSFLTTFMLGVMAGALIEGNFVLADGGASYWDTYWAPWLSSFTFSVGAFLVTLFAYQSSIFFVGEDLSDNLKLHFAKKSRQFNLAAVVSGLLVFLSAFWCDVPLASRFFSHPWSLGCMVIATLCIFPIWRGLNTFNKWTLRGLSGLQMTLIILGWVALQFPQVLKFQSGESVDLYGAAAPEATLFFLLTALCVGSVFIFPSLFYLFHVFKHR